jgi:branched-chain amino acid aminotransferase
MGAAPATSDWIWKDGEFIAWEDAQLHLLAHAVQFGTSLFEGIRCYETPEGPAVFRLREHIRRLVDSCTVYRMRPEWSVDELVDACVRTIAQNGLTDCYIRPMVIRGFGAYGLDPTASPIETYVSCWPWGAYLGPDALTRGVDVCTSSWWRAHPNTNPVSAKAAGHYLNAQLIRLEAKANGYAEGIALSPNGLVSEGSGQNLFLVRDEVVFTPFLDGSSLAGITRSAIMTIAEDLGYEVREQLVPRESLYTSDELFFTGTATEVTPIRSVDRIEVGAGEAGPVTRAIQERYFRIVRGEEEDRWGWRTVVRGEG